MNVPRLRFPAFSGEWIHEKLGNICRFSQGIQVDLELQINETKEGYVKFLRIENYTKNSSDFRFIPIELSSNKYITSKEIVVVRYGATAGYISRGFDGVLANNLFRIHPEIKILDNDFLFEYLKREQVFKYFQTVMFGGAMPALSFSIVRSLPLHYPRQLPEQTKIANFLTAIDEKITQLTQKHDLLKQYKKGVMQQIFSQKLRFKDDDGREFPEWGEKKFHEVVDIQGGYAFKSQNFNAGLTKVIRIGDIALNIRLSEFKGVYSSEKPSNKFLVKKNDAVIALSGATFGKVGKIIDDGEAFINQRVATFRTKQNLDYIYQILLSEEFKSYIASIPTSSAQPNISNDDIGKYQLKFPCAKEQTKIAKFLTAIDDKITHTQTQLNAVKLYKKGLLQQLFV